MVASAGNEGLSGNPVEYPAAVEGILDRLGATLAPLALFSVGYQLRLADLEGRVGALSVGRSRRSAPWYRIRRPVPDRRRT